MLSIKNRKYFSNSIDPETVCWSTQTKQWWQWWWSIGGIVCWSRDLLMTMTMIGKTWSRYCLLVRDLTSTSFPLESSFAISGTRSPRHTSTGTMRQFSQNIQCLMFPNRERVQDFGSFCSSTRWSLSQTLTHTWVQNIIGSTACRAISYSMIVFLAVAKLTPWQIPPLYVEGNFVNARIVQCNVTTASWQSFTVLPKHKLTDSVQLFTARRTVYCVSVLY